jgi:diguanylate cyclase (GGDEF)-like protein
MEGTNVGEAVSFSAVGLSLQLAVAILVTTLLFVLAQSLRRKYLDYWTIGWGCLAVGPAAVLAGQQWDGTAREILLALYAVPAVAFGALLVLGCLHYAGQARPRLARASVKVLAVAGAAFATVLLVQRLAARFPSSDAPGFNVLRGVILAGFALWAVVYLRQHARSRSAEQRVLVVALCGLVLYAGLAVGLLGWTVWGASAGALDLLCYAALFGVVIDILVAFGMVILAMNDVRRELETINSELAQATQRLQAVAQRDQMTEALNRHAFYSLVEGNRHRPDKPVGGCVAILDIDDLKPINDRHGHAAGDAAIRAVSKAIRAVIRADDLLFRWGGDEFLVLLPNVAPAEARSRFDRLGASLRQCALPGTPEPVDLHVSVGVAAFADILSLERAIEQADAQMYSRKSDRKLTGRPSQQLVPQGQ